MYPSSSSSSSQKPMGHTGLTRYGSAPGSLLTTTVDAVIGADPNHVGHYFTADSSSLTSESTCKVSSSNDPQEPKAAAAAPPHGSYPGTNSSSLLRQRSSPAGFLSHVTTENDYYVESLDMIMQSELNALIAGFSVTRGTGNYSSQGGANGGHRVSRLKSQLSFTRQDSLSQISEVSENLVDGVSTSSNHQNAAHSFAAAGFGMDSWDNTNSIVFSAPPSKRAKNIDGDFYNCLNALETQFSLPQTTLEMATVEKLLHIPEDSVPCKIRAKRGCATHPRSIAERERRTRISGKLKKLQELVPNMDKQTSYADMLDLAVEHIKGLQNEVQVFLGDAQTLGMFHYQALSSGPPIRIMILLLSLTYLPTSWSIEIKFTMGNINHLTTLELG
ncbi:Basic helix-loop-helix DNA-binding superfamily protein, putative [Theobroma cacao]|uniref:Basic helix-loop-helix DNA-binding superfamily protein, putative n=1 Tax=Theobroma cacao TaxID=3641 RepID=A0A061EKJ9_THECC|nr:Basic helix-loop-helix DNA-binding superfamily protein, putative [Theobroma cacao]